MTRIRAVVFDLDGTLIDSLGDIAASANHALERHGFSVLPEHVIAEYVGDGAEQLLLRAARLEAGDPRLESLYAAFLDYYAEHPTEHTKLCAGAESTLALLRDLPLALCTNKPRRTTARVLEGLGLDGCFEVVVAGDDLPLKKPDPAPLLHIAAALELDARELVMVGDGAQDVRAGHAAGARTVGMRGGMQPLERLLGARPDVVIDTLAELPGVLARFR